MKESKYVTLQDISNMVQQGLDVVIVDNKTKEDITAVTMAQVLYEQQKSTKNKIPLGAIKEMVLSGSEKLSKKITTPLTSLRDEVHTLRDEAERRVNTFRELAEKRLLSIVHDSRDKTVDARTLVNEVSVATTQALDEWARSVEDRLKNAMGLAGTVQAEGLEERLVAMESRLESLENRLKEIEAAFSGKTRG